MRILMLNNEFPPIGGGTGTVNQALLRRFGELPGLEIDLVTSAVGKEALEEAFAPAVRIFRLPVNRFNIHHASNRELLTYAARAAHFGWRLQGSRPYDFCFAWSAVPAGGSALTLRRLAGLPYLVRVCGPDIPGFERRYGPLYPVLKPAIRAIWHGAQTVVAKCEGEADMIRAVDPQVPVTIIPNGVDLAAFSPAGPIPDGGPLRLLCVARLIERKGQHHLISAVQRLTAEGVDVVLDLVGTGDAQAAYQAQAQDAGVAGRVRFVGYIEREAIAECYASAHVFVLPSYNEGMSVATLEAMAAGLPVIITVTGGTAELVADGENGLTFQWADVDTLVAHIKRLAADRELARQMGAASRMRAERFSWNVPASAYMKLFSQLAMQRPALYPV